MTTPVDRSSIIIGGQAIGSPQGPVSPPSNADINNAGISSVAPARAPAQRQSLTPLQIFIAVVRGFLRCFCCCLPLEWLRPRSTGRNQSNAPRQAAPPRVSPAEQESAGVRLPVSDAPPRGAPIIISPRAQPTEQPSALNAEQLEIQQFLEVFAPNENCDSAEFYEAFQRELPLSVKEDVTRYLVRMFPDVVSNERRQHGEQKGTVLPISEEAAALQLIARYNNFAQHARTYLEGKITPPSAEGEE
ncbi:MAG: hypothetical protein ACHQT8_02485 [Chlamydiales bacterium]